MARALCRYVTLVASVALLGGCAASQVQTYVGPALPADSVATLVFKGGILDVIDGRPAGRPLGYGSTWDGSARITLRPGVHSIWVSSRTLSNTTTAVYANIYPDVEARFLAEAGHVYISRGYPPTIIDSTSSAPVVRAIGPDGRLGRESNIPEPPPVEPSMTFHIVQPQPVGAAVERTVSLKSAMLRRSVLLQRGDSSGTKVQVPVFTVKVVVSTSSISCTDPLPAADSDSSFSATFTMPPMGAIATDALSDTSQARRIGFGTSNVSATARHQSLRNGQADFSVSSGSGIFRVEPIGRSWVAQLGVMTNTFGFYGRVPLTLCPV